MAEIVFPARLFYAGRDPAYSLSAGREKLLGILFGVLARTLVPYLRKLKQGKVKKFWNGYWHFDFAQCQW